MSTTLEQLPTTESASPLKAVEHLTGALKAVSFVYVTLFFIDDVDANRSLVTVIGMSLDN
ncbi:hypothetical protein PV325_000864, partial [Microctonus aethiopoides]